MYEYDLFAVINHDGNMSNGHYTNYARFGQEVSDLEATRSLYWRLTPRSGIASMMTSKDMVPCMSSPKLTYDA